MNDGMVDGLANNFLDPDVPCIISLWSNTTFSNNMLFLIYRVSGA